MQLIKPGINIDFIGKRRIAYAVSLLMLLASVGTLVYHGGPLYGVDFAGGSVIQVKFPAAVEIARIESALSGLNLGNASIQSFGEEDAHEYLIRTDLSGFGEADFGDRLREALTTTTGQSADIRRVEMVGPQVGKDLRAKALFAMFFALLFITIYISGRFELKWLLSGVVAAAMIGAVLLLQTLGFSIPVLIFGALAVSLVLFWLLKLKFAMGAIVSLMHDVLITVGCFSLFGKEFTLPIIAALLTIIGYSLNDTIIVFDRIRENRRKYLKDPLATIINRSVNETLSRTLLTSGTTLVVVLALFILGGGIIHDFAFALLVGIGVGTYSSIYVASPILLLWEEARRP